MLSSRAAQLEMSVLVAFMEVQSVARSSLFVGDGPASAVESTRPPLPQQRYDTPTIALFDLDVFLSPFPK